MRWFFAATVGLLALASASAQEKESTLENRYGRLYNRNAYPQATPKEALASVIKAIENKRIDYLLAHLADPAWVDGRVKDAGNDFETLVQQATVKLADDPNVLKDLRRFLKEGEWEGTDTTASAQLKDVKDRMVFFRKVEDRWFFENERKKEKGK